MSTTDIENTPIATAPGKNKHHNITKMSGSVLSAERKTLQTLQFNSKETSLTRPGDHLHTKEPKKEEKTKAKISPSNKPLQVFVDPAPEPSSGKKSSHSPGGSTECGCKCHEKTEEEKMIDHMTEDPTTNDWRNIAEERREALEETLVENRQLHFEVFEFKTQVKDLVQEVDELKDENRRLSQQRDYFANFLKTLMNEDNDASPAANASIMSVSQLDDSQEGESTLGSDDSTCD